MKHSKKICILVAVACVVAGLAIMAIGFVLSLTLGFRGHSNVRSASTPVKPDFSEIEIHALGSDVRILPSEDNRCRVDYTASERTTCDVSVEGGTLRIAEHDGRHWYEHISFSWWGNIVNDSITVYLPADSYNRLSVEGASSDVTVPAGFTFREAELATASGGINFSGTVQHTLELKTVSGDQALSGISCEELKVSTTSGWLMLDTIEAGALRVSSTSGDVTLTGGTIDGALELGTVSGELELHNVTADSAEFTSTSGDIDLENVALTDQLNIETTSGEIELEDCDAGGCWIKSTSGDVEGTLRSQMQFVTHTTSGDVSVPTSIGVDKICEITTTSGDIRMIVKP